MNLIGKMLDNRYEILEKIGNGGMATVYKAKCHVLNRIVAVKILRDEFTTDSEFIKKFNSEAQAAASLTHPNIVSIFDVGNQDNLYYIVMELIQGKTLKEIITEDGCLSWKWSVNIAIQIASALETAHKNSIIHRDIKPHNIMITEDGVAKVTDFGIAKAVSNSTITAFGTTIGSVHYFSPEHARGGFTDAKSDLYSLGIVMYEMLTERVPFDADTPVSVALKQVQEEPVDPIKYNPKIPISVNRIILKAMQKDPSLRYQNATEMVLDLSRALQNPDSDFVVLERRDENSPTQKIPTIHDYDLDKNVERITSRRDEPKKKESKIKAFYQKHKWAKPVTIIMGLILLFVIAMFGTIIFFNNSRPKQAEMPNVAGYNEQEPLSKEDAIELLNSLGFEDIKIEEDYSDDVEAGYVISQTPEYKTNYQINVTKPVTLVISKGQKLVTLPKKIRGKTLDEIVPELEELEIKYEVIEEHNEEVEAGIIISVDPEEGEEISASVPVNLTVSKGSAFKDVVVPNLLGRPEDEVRTELEELNLVVDISYEENTSKSDGVVTSQSIGSGKTIKEGSTVELVVNKLPEEATVTINVNLKSFFNYTEPTPVTKEEKDEFGNTVTTTVTPEIESANVVIKVGEDTIENEVFKKTNTNISKTWRTSGVKEVKIIIDGTTRLTQKIDFNKGDQVIELK